MRCWKTIAIFAAVAFSVTACKKEKPDEGPWEMPVEPERGAHDAAL